MLLRRRLILFPLEAGQRTLTARGLQCCALRGVQWLPMVHVAQ